MIKSLDFSEGLVKSLLSLQVSHNMYQIQSVNSGHFFPRPQPRQVVAELSVLALPQVSGEASHLRAVSSPFPKGPPLQPVPNGIAKVFGGQRKYEHGFRSPKNTGLCAQSEMIRFQSTRL